MGTKIVEHEFLVDLAKKEIKQFMAMKIKGLC